VLRVVIKYSNEVENPYSVDPKKALYDPSRYGYQYSNKMIREGFEKGARFLNRTPRFRETHPEVMDTVKAQRAIMVFGIIGVLLFTRELVRERNQQDRDMTYQLFKEKEFVDRYAYKQKEVEYLPTSSPPFS
jgi:hypothetical protein